MGQEQSRTRFVRDSVLRAKNVFAVFHDFIFLEKHPLPFRSANEKARKLAPRFISLAYDYRFFPSSLFFFLPFFTFYSRYLSPSVSLLLIYIFSFPPLFRPLA